MSVIAIDIDNVLLPLTEGVLKLYNSRSNKNIQMSDLTTYSFYECLPKEDADGIINLFSDKELWDSLTPISGSQSAIKSILKDGHTILLVTSTNPINFQWKCDMIQKYYPSISIDNVIRIMDKSYIKCDILIDDDMQQLTKSFCERICISYPWNISELKDYAYNIYRVDNLKDSVNIIKEIEKGQRNYE